MNSDPREEKLPRWAQQELQQLRMQVKEQAEQLAIATGTVGTDEHCGGFYVRRTGIDRTLARTPIGGLGQGLEFKLDERNFIGLRVEYTEKVRHLELKGLSYNGSSSLLIRPWASNVALVRLGD